MNAFKKVGLEIKGKFKKKPTFFKILQTYWYELMDDPNLKKALYIEFQYH